jgi:hypothetical protein
VEAAMTSTVYEILAWLGVIFMTLVISSACYAFYLMKRDRERE